MEVEGQGRWEKGVKEGKQHVQSSAQQTSPLPRSKHTFPALQRSASAQSYTIPDVPGMKESPPWRGRRALRTRD